MERDINVLTYKNESKWIMTVKPPSHNYAISLSTVMDSPEIAVFPQNELARLHAKDLLNHPSGLIQVQYNDDCIMFFEMSFDGLSKAMQVVKYLEAEINANE